MTISIRSLLSGPLCPTTRMVRSLGKKCRDCVLRPVRICRPMPSQKESGSRLQVVDVIDRQSSGGAKHQSALAFTARCDGAHLRRFATDRHEAPTESGHREMRRTSAPRVAPPSAVPAATSRGNSRSTAGRSAFQQSARTPPSADAASRAGRGCPKSALLRARAPRPLNSSPSESLTCCPLLLRIARCTH